MQRKIKRFLWLMGLLISLQYARGFALLGPLPTNPGGYPWQVPTIGYNLAYTMAILNITNWGGELLWLGDVGGPHAIGEEYRRNAPVIYYVYHPAFYSFFGPEGETAVDQAFNIMNNAFTNNPTGVTDGVDGYSASLAEFPLQSQSFNPTAQSLFLTDIKSVTLHLLVEQMGLAEPERFSWALHDRDPGPTCPFTTTYLVIQRNIDIATSPLNQSQYSAYINGILYTYLLWEVCSGYYILADTVAFPADPAASDQYTAVAANNFSPLGQGLFFGGGIGGGLQMGGFYTGLTRDDVGGLRYLLSTNNINLETAAAGSLMQHTNANSWFFLGTADLGALLTSAKTNDPAVLQVLFPGLEIAGSTNYPVVVTNPVIIAYFTNYPGEAYGTAPHLIFQTNGYTYTPALRYITTFANVVVTTNWWANSYRTNTSAQLQTVNVGYKPGTAYGSPLVTNVTYTTITLTNVPSGDYYLIPAGTCGFEIPNPQPTGYPIINVTATTNILYEAINSQGFYYSQSIVTYATNHIFATHPCTLEADTTGYYQGIQRVRFVRVADNQYDELTGNFTSPITNTYTMTFYDRTNYRTYTKVFQRVTTGPDILLTASDMADGPAGINFNFTVTRSTPNYSSVVADGANYFGPGVIDSPAVFFYNKVGDIFFNGPIANTNFFLYEVTHLRLLQWASFDSSTNEPTVYPNGTSLQNLINQNIIQISPTTLPVAANGVPYAVTFTVTGGQPPYTWSLAPDSAPLPGGLMISSGGTLSGTPTGVPAGTYDFKIQLNDSAARVVTWNLSITVN